MSWSFETAQIHAGAAPDPATGARATPIYQTTLVAGVDSDRLYPLVQQRELAAGISGADDVRVIESPYGHDAFLIESEQVGALVRELVPAHSGSR